MFAWSQRVSSTIIFILCTPMLNPFLVLLVRFHLQLFGDTVNTAARMESNGQKGRIQGAMSSVLAVRRGVVGYVLISFHVLMNNLICILALCMCIYSFPRHCRLADCRWKGSLVDSARRSRGSQRQGANAVLLGQYCRGEIVAWQYDV